MQPYSKEIWKRWIKKCVPALNRHSSCRTQKARVPTTGDIVWIVDDGNLRGHYPFATVSSLRYGNDDITISGSANANLHPILLVINLMPVIESSLLGPEGVANRDCKREEKIYAFAQIVRAVKTYMAERLRGSSQHPRVRGFESRQNQKFLTS